MQPLGSGYDTLCIDDLVFVTRWDLKFSWFRLGQQHYCTTTGVAQGSPGSPGEANLFAGVRKERWIRSLSAGAKAAVACNLCASRWYDDRLLIWRPHLPDFVLRDLRTPLFYHEVCPLKLGDTSYIGLQIIRRSGLVCNTAWSHFIESMVMTRPHRAGRLNAAVSFTSRRACLGSLVGHLVRVLDADVGSINQVLEALTNQVCEIIAAGHPPCDVRRALFYRARSCAFFTA